MVLDFVFASIQIILSVIIGLYFLNMLKIQTGAKASLQKESKKELGKLKGSFAISLTKPLSEATRPAVLKEIVGQDNALRVLRAALCSSNPQHVIIYGPPGVGKTAAARVILEEAKRKSGCPFGIFSKFIEIDATTLRYDERGIADPLIGSVHDPIYQGAGSYGTAGVPQPKPGAVTKAHGGVLFIDEIGELPSVQMNKLLKVLEDRRVFLESSYYSSENSNIPEHIHEIFKNGLPADFRLVGATTRKPEEIPPALRSRCVEVFFEVLDESDLLEIAKNAAQKSKTDFTEKALYGIVKYSKNGRDAVNMVQIASGLSDAENIKSITAENIEWIAETGRYSPRIKNTVSNGKRTGTVNILAVSGDGFGVVGKIEVSAKQGGGKFTVTGIVEHEEFDGRGQKMKKKSSAASSVENAVTLLADFCKIDFSKYDIHVNFMGASAIDGPSAGIAVVSALYSAIFKIPVDCELAMTGEISIQGAVMGVGGIVSKLKAAQDAGIKKVIIPETNKKEGFEKFNMDIKAISHISGLFKEIFGTEKGKSQGLTPSVPDMDTMSAKGA